MLVVVEDDCRFEAEVADNVERFAVEAAEDS